MEIRTPKLNIRVDMILLTTQKVVLCDLFQGLPLSQAELSHYSHRSLWGLKIPYFISPLRKHYRLYFPVVTKETINYLKSY